MNIKMVTLNMVLAVTALAAVGCTAATANQMPALDKTGGAQRVEVLSEDLLAQKDNTQEIELTYPNSLILELGANATTGFQWQPTATISDTAVLTQYEHNYVGPGEGAPIGAGGKDVYTFKPAARGTATITLGYSRPWEGGEKNVVTYTLKVTVK